MNSRRVRAMVRASLDQLAAYYPLEPTIGEVHFLARGQEKYSTMEAAQR